MDIELEIRQGTYQKPDTVAYELNEADKTVRVGVTENEGTSWTPALTKDQLTDLIWYLGQARRDLERGETIPTPEQRIPRVVVDPAWFTAFIPERSATMLTFNHPLFGAIGFMTPVVHAATLMRLLASQMEAYIHSTNAVARSEAGDGA